MDRKKVLLSLVSLAAVLMFVSVIQNSTRWCQFRGYFNITAIRISGCILTTSEDILETSGLKRGQDVRQIDCAAIQAKLEQYPYIKAATVSRQFPSGISIEVKERMPVCFLNGAQIMLADNEGVLLPMPNNYLRRDLPVISGYEELLREMRPGMKIFDIELSNIIAVVDKMLCATPELFSQISEFRYNAETGSYTLYSIDAGTPIYCGHGPLAQKMNILAHFEYVMRGRRRIDDFQYLDLRWNDQVIVKEKRS